MHFEFKTLRSPTVVRLVSAAVPQVKKLRKNYFSLRLRRRPYYFFTATDREREIARNFSLREFWSLVQLRGSSSIQRKARSSVWSWRHRSGDILCCYEFQPTYHKSNWVTLTYAQCPRLVWPSVRVLGKPLLKRGRAGTGWGRMCA